MQIRYTNIKIETNKKSDKRVMITTTGDGYPLILYIVIQTLKSCGHFLGDGLTKDMAR